MQIPLDKVQNKGTSLDTARQKMSKFQIHFKQKLLSPPIRMIFKLSEKIYFMAIPKNKQVRNHLQTCRGNQKN